MCLSQIPRRPARIHNLTPQLPAGMQEGMRSATAGQSLRRIGRMYWASEWVFQGDFGMVVGAEELCTFDAENAVAGARDFGGAGYDSDVLGRGQIL